MENLWPVDLLRDVSSSDLGWNLLEAQAVAISQATKGLVQGELRRRNTSTGRSSALYLLPTDQPMKGYEFMAIRSLGESFPLALEVFHLGESRRIWQIHNSSELKRVLRKIFADEATSRIVRALAHETLGVQSAQTDDSRADPGQAGHEAVSDVTTALRCTNENLSRPIAVGGLIVKDGKTFSTVTLLGIAGFVSKDELRKLVMKPDARGSAVNTLNDRFVVTVSFLDSVKMTLNADELKVLRSEVQRVLNA